MSAFQQVQKVLVFSGLCCGLKWLFKSLTLFWQSKFSWVDFHESSSSSAILAMLDFQSGEEGEIRSLPQCLNRSPKLPVGVHQTWPFASQVIEGGAGLQDVVGGLRTRAAWTFVWVGNFQSVEVGEELTVSSSQSKDCDLSCSVQPVDAVLLCLNV